jgi:decaprenylphospho-beta-D-erythro-pentofuranosid-2-ulose 2-reductase
MSHNEKHIVIIGATSSIAEHCARLWLSDPTVKLTLVGRSFEKLERMANDLRIRNPQTKIQAIEMNFMDPAAIRKLADDIALQGAVHTVLIAHGSLPDQLMCQTDLNENLGALNVNGVSPVLFAESFASHMERENTGTLILIGSVAGDRGRKSNYVYGAAKGLVTRYAQGLQHRLSGTNVNVVLVKPGPTDTPMTAAMKQKGVNLASVEAVAKSIVSGAAKGRAVIYAPIKWQLIMMIIRHLPHSVFKKLDI